MVIFKKFRETNVFVVYKTAEVNKIGQWTDIYVKKSCELSDYNELELIAKK